MVESTCNQKRDYGMAGDNSFTELSKLAGLLSAFPLFCVKIRLSVVVRQLDFVRQLKYKDFIYDILKLNSLLQSYCSWKKLNQLVESTCSRTQYYSMTGNNCVTELSKLEGSLSASPPTMTSFESQSYFVSWILLVSWSIRF